jgi:hypothetical protein
MVLNTKDIRSGSMAWADLCLVIFDNFEPFSSSNTRYLMDVLLTVRSYAEPILSPPTRPSIRDSGPIVLPVYSLL